MKKILTIQVEVDVAEFDYYNNEFGAGCSECVMFNECRAVSDMAEQFPYSFQVVSSFPCHQMVPEGKRHLYKFSSK